jgi:glycosyltransferase involved in cell wall biosynthesis
MKKILFVHHTMQSPGGGSSVGAWALEALRKQYDVTVLTWSPVDLTNVNRVFGTHLEETGVRWESIGAVTRMPIDMIPLRLALLNMHVLFCKARALHRAHRYDIVFSTINEIEIGVRAIQYVHYPWANFPRPDADYSWYHFSPPLHAYRWLCSAISGYQKERVPLNVSLVNSDWTGRVFKLYYGAEARTIYPPVPGGFPDVPFEARENGFVCVGRFSREKEIDKLIRILIAVRAHGHEIRFRIVGHVDDRSYAQHLYRLAEPYKDWITFHHDLPRDEMVALIARNRYGIHGMVGEHFGIAPAELQRGGCITFVPDDGGVVEIVGGDERLIYHSEEDAVDKIDRMLRDPNLRAATLRDVNARAALFSEERFMAEILDVVDNFDA